MKALQLHLVLALVALFAAIGARRRAEDHAPVADGRALVECAPQRVELRGPRSVTVEPSDEGIAVSVEAGEGVVRFVGGRSAAALLEELGELHAIRSFEAEPSVDYGFGEGRLRIVCAERTLEWALGASPPGSADRYLGGESGAVHLIVGGPIRALEEAEVRLMRRALHDFEESEVSRVELTLPGGATRALVQRFGDDPNRRRWLDPTTPGERVPAFDRLMGAHRNLRADAGAEDPDGEKLGSMTFEGDEGALGTLELVRSGDGPSAVYLVRTDALGWVRVPRSTGTAFARAIDRLRSPPVLE